MTPTQIFGELLRDMMAYVGWLETREGQSIVEAYRNKRKLHQYLSAYSTVISLAHTFLSQPMQESWFVRPPEPNKEDFKINPVDHYGSRAVTQELTERKTDFWYHHVNLKKARVEWEDWQPLFLGEWKIDPNDYEDVWFFELDGQIIEVRKDWTRNDFALHCAAQNIPLELNPEYHE